MKVIVTGCSNPKLEQEIIYATKFFTKELLSRQMYRHISLEIVIKNKIEDLGTCCITYYNDWYKAREFEIQLRKKKSLKNLLLTLAHEIVHVKQFAKGELNCDNTKWKGEKIDTEKVSYFDLPWEVEASSYEYILYSLYQEYRKKKIGSNYG